MIFRKSMNTLVVRGGVFWCLVGGLAVAAQAQNATPQVAALPSTSSIAMGVTQAVRDVKLSMTVAGRIDAVLVREGARVRQGQLLMHLDRALEELEVQRRQLLLDDNARLQELKLKEATLMAQVAALRPLLSTGGVSRKQLEDEEMSLGAVSAERKAVEASKARERVELALAQEAFERRHLRSPIDGVVTKVALRVGESVGPHEPVIAVVDTSRVRFMGTVPARGGVPLRVGSTVTIELGQESTSRSRTAKVVFVSPITDPSSGLVEVIAEFDNADGTVRPGISGRLVF
jgi:membrane fusion protein, multidrug efflux system